MSMNTVVRQSTVLFLSELISTLFAPVISIYFKLDVHNDNRDAYDIWYCINHNLHLSM